MFELRIPSGVVVAHATEPIWLDFQTVQHHPEWTVVYRVKTLSVTVASVKLFGGSAAEAAFKVCQALTEARRYGAFDTGNSYPLVKVRQ